MTQPTRTEIIAVLASHTGEGKIAMETAVAGYLEQFEMTDEQKKRVMDDLISYSEYTNEL